MIEEESNPTSNRRIEITYQPRTIIDCMRSTGDALRLRNLQEWLGVATSSLDRMWIIGDLQRLLLIEVDPDRLDDDGVSKVYRLTEKGKGTEGIPDFRKVVLTPVPIESFLSGLPSESSAKLVVEILRQAISEGVIGSGEALEKALELDAILNDPELGALIQQEIKKWKKDNFPTPDGDGTPLA